MRRFVILKVCFVTVWILQAVPPAFSEEGPSKEYDDVTVVLIDPRTGALGVLYTDEITGQQEKKAFLVNFKEADIFNHLNQELEFSKIEVGHQLDIFTETDLKGGAEKIVEILDRSYVEKE